MSKKDLNREPSADIVKPYEPTLDERAAEEAIRVRWAKTPRVKVSSDASAHKFELEHPSPYHAFFVLMEALGTADSNFYLGIVPQLARAATVCEKVDEQALNFLIAVIVGVKPRDQLETMLAAQLAAVHCLVMDYARRLSNASDIVQRDSAERTLNKLARTFATQMETLKRHRSTEQRVVVEHVTVNTGGQAIVGNVAHGGAGSSEKPG